MAMAQKYYQSSFGPSDPHAKRSEVEGFQPVSRIGEIVVNAFVDTQEFIALKDHMSSQAQYPRDAMPPYHEWAAALPGMVMIARKMNAQVFRHLVAAETSIPCVSCVSCMTDRADFGEFGGVYNTEAALTARVNRVVDSVDPGIDARGGAPPREEGAVPYTKYDDWYFAGVCRSKSVPPVDDGNGPSHDEYFTLALGGMVTMQNSSDGVIYPNDAIVWDFRTDHTKGPGQSNLPAKRHEQGPLRVGVRSTKEPNHERLIGRALSFARAGEPFDLLLKQ